MLNVSSIEWGYLDVMNSGLLEYNVPKKSLNILDCKGRELSVCETENCLSVLR